MSLFNSVSPRGESCRIRGKKYVCVIYAVASVRPVKKSVCNPAHRNGRFAAYGRAPSVTSPPLPLWLSSPSSSDQ